MKWKWSILLVRSNRWHILYPIAWCWSMSTHHCWKLLFHCWINICNRCSWGKRPILYRSRRGISGHITIVIDVTILLPIINSFISLTAPQDIILKIWLLILSLMLLLLLWWIILTKFRLIILRLLLLKLSYSYLKFFSFIL